MSQPKRYRPVFVGKDRVEMHQCVSGEWTSLTDYYTLHDRLDALAAEKEAETRATFDAIRTITQLRAENERLRKAGDVLMECYCVGDLAKEEWKHLPSVAAWNAAKEGRDAK